MLQAATSLNVFSDHGRDDAPYDSARGPQARPNVLLASLGVAAVTFVVSGASMLYAFTHIPEVDPDADPAPVAAVAAIAAEASATPAKLEVLPPPVYAGVVSEAPAMTFIPLGAHTHVDTATIDAVDPYKLAQADGETQPCADPCVAQSSAQAGYVAEPADSPTSAPVHAIATPIAHDANVTQDEDANGDDATDDDGNAPPPPGLALNGN